MHRIFILIEQSSKKKINTDNEGPLLFVADSTDLDTIKFNPKLVQNLGYYGAADRSKLPEGISLLKEQPNLFLAS